MASASPRTQIGVTLLSTAPLAVLPFICGYWPSQDGPNHVAVAQVASHVLAGDAFWSSQFALHLAPRPYLAHYYFLIGVGRLLGNFAAAQRVLDALLIASSPLAALILIRRTLPERWMNALLVVPLSTSWCIMMGFTNFVIGLLLAVVTVAIVWGRSGGRGEFVAPLSRAELTWAAVTSILTAFAHPFALVLLCLAITVLEPPRPRAYAPFFRAAAAVTPGGLFLVVWVLFSIVAPHASSGGADPVVCTPSPVMGPACPTPHHQFDFFGPVMMTWFLLLGSATISPLELATRGVGLALMLGLLLRTWRSTRRSTAMVPTERALLRLALVLLALYYLLPFSDKPVHSYMSARVMTALLPIAPAAIRAIGKRTATVVVLLGFVLAATQFRASVPISALLGRVAHAAPYIPRHSRLLPVSFDPAGGAVATQPLLHAYAYIVTARDVYVPCLFAARAMERYGAVEFRPLVYRREPAKILGQQPAMDLAAYRADHFQYLWDVAREYDYVLFLAPPPDLLRAWRGRVEIVYEDGFVYLVRPSTVARSRPERSLRPGDLARPSSVAVAARAELDTFTRVGVREEGRAGSGSDARARRGSILATAIAASASSSAAMDTR